MRGEVNFVAHHSEIIISNYFCEKIPYERFTMQKWRKVDKCCEDEKDELRWEMRAGKGGRWMDRLSECIALARLTAMPYTQLSFFLSSSSFPTPPPYRSISPGEVTQLVWSVKNFWLLSAVHSEVRNSQLVGYSCDVYSFQHEKVRAEMGTLIMFSRTVC